MRYIIQAVDSTHCNIPAGRQLDEGFETRVLDEVTGCGAEKLKVLYSIMEDNYVANVDLEIFDELTNLWKKGVFTHTNTSGIAAIKCRNGIVGKTYAVKASILDGKETSRHSIVLQGNITLDPTEILFVPQGGDFRTIKSIIKEVPVTIRLINTHATGVGIRGVLARISVTGAITLQHEGTLPLELMTGEDGRLTFIIEPHIQGNIRTGTLSLSIPSFSYKQNFNIKIH